MWPMPLSSSILMPREARSGTTCNNLCKAVQQLWFRITSAGRHGCFHAGPRATSITACSLFSKIIRGTGDGRPWSCRTGTSGSVHQIHIHEPQWSDTVTLDLDLLLFVELDLAADI